MGLSSSKTRSTSSERASATTNPIVPGFIQQPSQNYFQQVGQFSGMRPTTFGPTANQQAAFAGVGALGNTGIGQGMDTLRGLLNYTPQQVSAGQVSANRGDFAYNPALMGAPERVGVSRSDFAYNPALMGAPNQVSANRANYSPAMQSLQPDVNVGQLSNTNLDPYMNPYARDVIDATMADFNQGNQLGLNALRASTPTGAFGGSRQGVAMGQLVGDNSRSLASTLAALRAGNFEQARQGAQFDIGNRFAADQFNTANRYNVGAANQAADNSMRALFAGADMQGQLANQDANFRFGATNAAAQNAARAQEASQYGAGALQSALANQDAFMRFGAANQAAQNAARSQEASQYGSAAMQAALANQDAGLRGALANQSADQFGAQYRLNAAQQLINSGQAADANARANLGLQADLGGQERAIQQGNDPYAQEAARLAALYSLLGIDPSSFMGQQVDSSGTASSTSKSSRSGLDIMGQLLSIGSGFRGK